MDNQIKNLLAKRKDKCIAIILSVKEGECDRFLDDEASYALRKVVLDQVNDLFDLSVDLMQTQFVFNEEYLRKIEDIHEVVTNDGYFED